MKWVLNKLIVWELILTLFVINISMWRAEDKMISFNFASKSAGATILDYSPAEGKGFSNLLTDDKDKYAISPCASQKWVIVGLSEEILVGSIAISNYEQYSSSFKVYDSVFFSI